MLLQRLRTKKLNLLWLAAALFLTLAACRGPDPAANPPVQGEEGEVPPPEPPRAAQQPAATPPDPNVETMPVTLSYVLFGREHQVRREIPRTQALARALVEELYRGFTTQEATYQVIPPGTRLLDVKIIDEIAYLDFSPEFRNNHWGGVEAEVNTIFSLVHTLTRLPGVEAVQFLVEGRQVRTIASGAVDLSEPVRPLEEVSPAVYDRFLEKVQEPARGVLTWEDLVREEGVVPLPPGEPADLAWGDLTGDGSPELVVLKGKRLAVWEDGGQGYNQVWETWLAAPGRVVLGDTTGDGRAEIIAYTDSHIYVFAHQDAGYRQQGWQGVAGSIASLAVGDTTGDGREEMILLYGTGDPFAAEYTAVVEIWQYRDQAYVKAFQGGDLPFRRLEVADITGSGREEIVTFCREGLTVFSWNGKAYVEVYRNPAIGGAYSTMAVGDLTGDGRTEVVLGDGLGRDIYVYTWEKDHLQKTWQTGNIMGDIMAEPFLVQDLDGDGRAELLVPTQADGGYLIFRWDGESFSRYILGESSGGERILEVFPGSGGRLLFTRRQLASSPQYNLYLGRWREPEFARRGD